MKSSTSCARCERDALVDHFEDRVAHHEMLLARTRRTGQLELSSVELFVNHDRAGAVPGQNLHAVTALAHEHEQGPRARLGSHPLSNKRAEPLAAHAHVDRLQRYIDRQAVRNHAAPSLSAATTARSSSASNPGLTRIATLPVHTSIEWAASLPRTSRANVGSAVLAVLVVAGVADRERRALRVGFLAVRTQ